MSLHDKLRSQFNITNHARLAIASENNPYNMGLQDRLSIALFVQDYQLKQRCKNNFARRSRFAPEGI